MFNQIIQRPSEIVRNLVSNNEVQNQAFVQPRQIVKNIMNGVKDYAHEVPGAYLMRGDLPGFAQRSKELLTEQYGNPVNAAINVMPMAGITKPLIKQIDNFTKDEMIKAIDYIRLKQPFNQEIENSIGYLAEKFGVKGRRYGIIANNLEKLVEGTKTKDISNRVPLFRVDKLK